MRCANNERSATAAAAAAIVVLRVAVVVDSFPSLRYAAIITAAAATMAPA